MPVNSEKKDLFWLHAVSESILLISFIATDNFKKARGMCHIRINCTLYLHD